MNVADCLMCRLIRTPIWQTSFWGSNYNKLLKTKKGIDPEGVLYGRACVDRELLIKNVRSSWLTRSYSTMSPSSTDLTVTVRLR